jgi:hypothetical protein
MKPYLILFVLISFLTGCARTLVPTEPDMRDIQPAQPNTPPATAAGEMMSPLTSY